jgi:hypothetical protein
MPSAYPDHVVKVSGIADLDKMLAAGRVVDEMALPPPRPSTSASSGSGDTLPRIKLKVKPLRRTPTKTKAVPKKSKIAKTSGAVPTTPASASGVDLELVWESKPLTRRDLTIPAGKQTNQTGSVNLDKGLLEDTVDHRHYFRDEVFAHLKWTPRSKTVEEAFAKFHLVLKGISYGEYDLAIRHSTSKTSTSYKQKNAMTRLSWGPMREFVARPDLIERTLALYRDRVDPKRFVLEID